MRTLPQTQGQTIPDAWDYKGRPAVRSKTGGWAAAAMILGLQQHHLPCFFPTTAVPTPPLFFTTHCTLGKKTHTHI